MNKIDYVQKLNHMGEERTQQGKNTEREDTTYSDLKRFQDFIYRHFKDLENKMCQSPINQVIYLKRHWRRSGVFIVNFEHISHLVLVFLLLTLNM